MLYYKFEVAAPEKNVMEEANRVERMNYINDIKHKTISFNEEHKKTFCFVYDITETSVIACIICNTKTDVDVLAKEYIEFLGFSDENYLCEEIMLKQLSSFLSRANRGSMVSGEDEILEQFNLDRLVGHYGRALYGERIIKDMEKDELYKEAKQYLAVDSLIPEYDRIYEGRKDGTGEGHPVHYVVLTENHEVRKKIYGNLLSALYANGRLASKRYTFFDINEGDPHDRAGFYEDLYKSSIGSTIVIRVFKGDFEEDDRAADIRIQIENVCRQLKKYRNKVLTIICIPRDCIKIRDMFNEYLDSMCIVDITEEVADRDKSIWYLNQLADDREIKVDTSLTDKLNSGELYTSSELMDMFEAWYNDRLKKKVYPQYEQFESIKSTVYKEKAKGSGISDLNEMIGLTNAKSVIKKALSFYKIQKLYHDQGIATDKPAMHMVFTGNPGTAKTTVARLFAKIMKENDVLPKGQLVEVGRSDLVGKYVGWTAKVVMQKFNEAMGGVLFIDEAYSLVDDRNGSYGDEAINTIVQEMENRRNQLIVIFAGYPDKMEEFINKNPGLRSRIAFHVPFDDYNASDLCEITNLLAKKNGIILTEGAIDKLSSIYDEARKNSDFGNGRFARNVLEVARMNQATRLAELPVDEITKTEIMTIREEDIESPIIGKTEVKKHIGFCA